ncbi:sigma 54-interacting transcriptional regulator [Thiomicrorhabdus sp. ZW0627]|uniref:sigma 54-interacting transcriptional regulator n=1 Tax=Thiomicrorhabdus sp. ZW0627 TaxID=3039774 RepID=UPI002436D3BF|nr:sigma 54-interacting transcriptional regulator [Thiomicrorhabdus sp. ZW0627]MDG6774651.1 sigma 54-interacting transcriptional regulator [Thiomicrorhabdus sp. ZW0627]
MRNIYEDLFEKNQEAILIIDPFANRIIQANPTALKLFYITQDTLESLSVTQLFRPSLSKLVVFTEEVLEKKQAWSNELQALPLNKQPIDLEMSAILIEAGSESSPVIACTIRNKKTLEDLRQISDANKLHRDGLEHWQTIENVFREFERENQLILRAVGEGIYGVDVDGNTTFINPAGERMLGWKAEELIGKNMHAMIHHSHSDGTEYIGDDCHIYAAIRDGEVRHVENELFWRKDGNSIPIEYTSTPIMDNGRLVGAVVIFRDISERKLAEEKLHSALNEVQTLKKRLELENAYLQEEYRSEHNYKQIVGKSAAIHKIIQQIELVAPTDANVLITGESGTGKELIARAIHESSGRKNRPLIRVNCASIPRELFESEFFGHIKGAFTGAVTDRAGRFELADGGSLFLDEVGEIPMELQSKLLRVLQEQQFERVGESKTRSVDVRIIAATNRDLKQEVQAKNFREDLYFRLNVFPIESIPLRERIEDIPLLADHFLKLACRKFAKPPMNLTVGDIQKMKTYSWPGNIRELVNVIERAIILSNEKKLELNLPKQNVLQEISSESEQKKISVQTKQERLEEEKQNIINALTLCNGKVFGNNGAAELLNLKPTTLTSKIKKLGINRHNYIQIQ